jgi:hypothetical protein
MGCKGREGGKKKAEIDAQKVIHTTLSPIEIIIYFFFILGSQLSSRSSHCMNECSGLAGRFIYTMQWYFIQSITLFECIAYNVL